MAVLKVEGLEDLQKALKKNVTMDDVKNVVRKNGSDMQGKAQDKSPVDTGNLKRSIGLDITDSGFAAEVEAKAEYAPYVEYGTRFMDAQPYMKPAYNDQKTKFKSDMKKLVR